MPQSPRVQIAKTPVGLAEIAADLFFTAATEKVDQEGNFFVALSGGSTPRGMHKLLARSPYGTGLPWHSIHLFWVDERCVPHTEEASNFGRAYQDFLKVVSIPPNHIHPMPTKEGSEHAASAYETEIRNTVSLNPNGMPAFDLAFLGVGQDGHTASLFPQDPALKEDTRWVLPVHGGTPYTYRYTMTLPVLNSVNHVVFLVSGIDKAGVVKRILESAPSMSLPAQRVRPATGKVTWLLDRAAASRL